MNGQSPHVSLGLPVYNGERYLRYALDAVLAQTFEDFELIICDNASTDATEVICREYVARDARIRYHRNAQNLGAAPNYNRTFDLSRGQYFKWMAHDDLLAPEFLSYCVGLLDRQPDAVLCQGQTVFIDPDGQGLRYDPIHCRFFDRLGRGYRKPEFLPKLQASDPASRYGEVLFNMRWCFEVFGIIRADVLQRTSLIGPYYGSDKVLLAELSLMGRLVQLPEPLFFRRCHAEQSSFARAKTGAWIATQTKFPPLGGFGKFIFPRVMCTLGYWRAIFKTPLSWDERGRCLWTLLRWLLKVNHWHRFAAEMDRQSRHIRQRHV
jgi:glycosyltransferase involved in cell wall biosynthesis